MSFSASMSGLGKTDDKLSYDPRSTSYVPKDCIWMEIGLAELEMSAWLRLRPVPAEANVALGDPRLAMPELTKIAQAKLGKNSSYVSP